MNSIIEAQMTLEEEIQKELERCKNWKYYYITYCRIVKENGKTVKPKISELGLLDIDRWNL